MVSPWHVVEGDKFETPLACQQPEKKFLASCPKQETNWKNAGFGLHQKRGTNYHRLETCPETWVWGLVRFSPFTCCFRRFFRRSFTVLSATRTPNSHNYSYVHYALSKFTGERFTNHSDHIHKITPILRIGHDCATFLSVSQLSPFLSRSLSYTCSICVCLKPLASQWGLSPKFQANWLKRKCP